MREKPKDKGRLLHIQEAITNIEEFLNGKSAEDLSNDKMLYFAVVKNLEIIGEAAYMLTNDFKETHSSTNWKDITNMRHILVHGYYQIDARIVWVTAQNDLHPLRVQISNYLKELMENPKLD
jgi:uncharacterized protein with HEPN domain